MEDMKLSKKIKAIMEDLGIDLEKCEKGSCVMCPLGDMAICPNSDFPQTISILETLEDVAEKYVCKADLAKNLKIDDPILVSNDGKYWRKSHFACFENGMFWAWEGGNTSWTTKCSTPFKFAKLPKKEFNWEAFKNGNVAVHCKTKELAKDFLEKADEQNFAWTDGQSLTKISNWEEYKEDTCYSALGCAMRYCKKLWYKKPWYKVIDWGDCK